MIQLKEPNGYELYLIIAFRGVDKIYTLLIYLSVNMYRVEHCAHHQGLRCLIPQVKGLIF